MNETRPSPLGSEYQPKLFRVLLVMTPVMFVLCYALSWIQNAEPWICLLISGVGTAGVLVAAVLYRLRGTKAASDGGVIMVILSAIAWYVGAK